LQLFPKTKKNYLFFPDCDIADGGERFGRSSVFGIIGGSGLVARALRKASSAVSCRALQTSKAQHARASRRQIIWFGGFAFVSGLRFGWKDRLPVKTGMDRLTAILFSHFDMRLGAGFIDP